MRRERGDNGVNEATKIRDEAIEMLDTLNNLGLPDLLVATDDFRASLEYIAALAMYLGAQEGRPA
jgi:hypothetical protein